jgi:NADPH-dependent curcumin reductase CurA
MACIPLSTGVHFVSCRLSLFDNWYSRARIIICGQISTYNTPDTEPPMGPRLLHNLLWKSARMQGFLVQDYLEHDAKVHHKNGAETLPLIINYILLLPL